MTGQIALLAIILHDKKKSGGSLPDSCRDSYAVDVLCAVVDLLQQFRGVQASEPLLGHQQHLPDDGRGVLHILEPFRRIRPEPEGGEWRLDQVVRPQVDPVCFGKLVKGEHPVPVSVQDLGDRLESALSDPLPFFCLHTV